ncbi:MAG: OB-fold nucleic acid binding domain-containing protein, partial [Mariprofundaceae bacterium]
MAVRRRKLEAMRQAGEAYPNTWRSDIRLDEIHRRFGALDAAQLEAESIRVRVAGRMIAHRVMGKTSFIRIQDADGAVQLFLARDELGADDYNPTKKWDLGDIIGAEGTLFRTRTGELSVRCRHVEMITKCLRPLPEKWHGLADKELKYRQRYLDLIVSPDSRETFKMRSRIVSQLRQELESRGFIEVETPMLQTQPGGALA